MSESLPVDSDYEICNSLEEIEGNKWPELDDPMTFALQSTNICNEDLSADLNSLSANTACCKFIVGGNPTVNLDERFIDIDSIFQLDLSSLNLGEELVILNKKTSLGSELLLTVKIDDPICSSFPDPIDNDFRGPDSNHPRTTSPYPLMTCSKFNPDPPVFGLLPDGGYALHDLRLQFQENTIENPLMDGGGEKMLAAAAASQDQDVVMFCSNAPMNIFNEKNCKLSYEENVCTKFDEEVASSLKLNTETLTAFHLMGRHVYAMVGLRFDSTNHPLSAITNDTKVDLPCDEKKYSRWVPIGDDECNSSKVHLHDLTKSAFEHSIYSSNDKNEFVKDVFFRGTCHEDDVNKTGMMVHVVAENQCYKHVHPNYM